MTFKNLFIEHRRSAEQEAWVKEELAEQERRFEKIDRQMRELAPRRAKWYEEFFDRISRRGFNCDGDEKVVVKRENLPQKPADREDRVVWKDGVDSES